MLGRIGAVMVGICMLMLVSLASTDGMNEAAGNVSPLLPLFIRFMLAACIGLAGLALVVIEEARS